MKIFYYFIFAISGLIIGSFLNVIIYRLPRKISILKPRSFCPNCNSKIRLYDNIPIFSYIFLNGKCRVCKHKISIRYPVVEFLTSLLFVLNYHYFSISLSCLRGILFCISLIIVSFIDAEFQIIPNSIIFPFLLLGILLSIIINPKGWWVVLAYSAGAFFFMLIINLLFPKGMGMGDVKLSLMAGAFLSQKIIPGLFIGFLVGSLFGIFLIIFKKKTIKQTISFGPFISIGCVIALFFGDKIINWYLRFI